MYERHFGLREKPFSLLPDPRFLYAGRAHSAALSLLEYGLSEQVGFVILTGEVGTGKTTLVRYLLDEVGDDIVIGLITTTHGSFGELMKWVLRAFDLPIDRDDPVERHETFVDFLVGCYARGKRAVLIVDEAQNLGEEALEQLRMLSNVNAGADHLLQIILVGQPELRAMLQRPSLRQVVQRIAVDYHLSPLDRGEATAYLRHRLVSAGGLPELFDDEACAAVHWFANGIPRLMNALADLAMVWAYADDRRHVAVDCVIDAALARSAGNLAAFRSVPEGVGKDELKRLIRAQPHVSVA